MIKVMARSLIGLFTLAAAALCAYEDLECSQEILYTYFPKPFVQETMQESGFSSQDAQSIADELAKMDQKITMSVEQKAQERDPNPLMSPDRHEEVVQIFKETLLEVFSDVLKQHGMKDAKKAQNMLESIQEKKGRHFARCLEEGNMPEFPEDQEEESETDQDEDGYSFSPY